MVSDEVWAKSVKMLLLYHDNHAKRTKYFQTFQPCILLCLFCVMYIVHYRFWSYVKKISSNTCYLSTYFLSCHHFYQERNNPLSLSLSLYKLSFFSGPWQPMMTSFLHDPWHCLRLLRLHCRPRPRLGVIASLSPPLRYWVTGDNYLLQSISTISTQYLQAESCKHSNVQWRSM